MLSQTLSKETLKEIFSPFFSMIWIEIKDVDPRLDWVDGLE